MRAEMGEGVQRTRIWSVEGEAGSLARLPYLCQPIEFQTVQVRSHMAM